jgi:hypothetical protein
MLHCGMEPSNESGFGWFPNNTNTHPSIQASTVGEHISSNMETVNLLQERRASQAQSILIDDTGPPQTTNPSNNLSTNPFALQMSWSYMRTQQSSARRMPRMPYLDWRAPGLVSSMVLNIGISTIGFFLLSGTVRRFYWVLFPVL